MCPNTHYSTAYSSQDTEATWTSTDIWTHEEDVTHLSTEYYSAIKSDQTGPSAVMRMNLESVTQSEVSEKNKYHTLTHTYGN